MPSVTADARMLLGSEIAAVIICGATTSDSVEPRLAVKAKSFRRSAKQPLACEPPLRSTLTIVPNSLICAARKRVLRMDRQARVMHAFDRRV